MSSIRAAFAALIILSLSACMPGGLGAQKRGPYAPGVKSGGSAVDPMTVGHRLMQAGEHELALQSYTRAAARHDMTTDVVSALGSANLGLGRLGQAEKLLRRAIAAPEARPEAWNNLGVVLMETDQTAEAVEMFRRAYALSNGQSDSIRDNLRLALAKLENPGYDAGQQSYRMVRPGGSGGKNRPFP